MWKDESGITLWSTMVVCTAIAMVSTGLMSVLWRSANVLGAGASDAQAAWLCRSDAVLDLRALEAKASLTGSQAVSPNGTVLREVTRTNQICNVRITATVGGAVHVLQFQYDDTAQRVSSWQDNAAHN